MSSSPQQVEEPYDPERSFFYPLQLDLDLERDFGEYVTFDVEDGKESNAAIEWIPITHGGVM